jgi:hypothetical protein
MRRGALWDCAQLERWVPARGRDGRVRVFPQTPSLIKEQHP